jgi:hypothetical protein
MNTKPEFIVREDLQQVGVNLLPLLLKGLEDVLQGARGGARVSSRADSKSVTSVLAGAVSMG